MCICIFGNRMINTTYTVLEFIRDILNIITSLILSLIKK